MPHTCNADNCSNPVFGGGKCKFHQFQRRMFGGDLYQAKPKQNKPSEPRSKSGGYKIPRRTKERATDEKYYAEQAKDFYNEAVINGTNLCFFCGEKVLTFQGLHHLKGRVGKYLLDKLWWVIVHNKCHTEDYHSANAQQRMRQPWWPIFLSKLRAKSEELYLKEIKKIEKSIS